jgi:5S rRNA maturation endonuclease (ribonuclease M5)
MDYKKSLQKLEEGIQDLGTINKTVPIIVEGEKDINALNTLGIHGHIIPLNTGVSILNLCDTIAKRWNEIIILTDWDKQGGRLCKRIIDNLQGRTRCNTDFRKIFAKNAIVKDLEGLPSYIENLKKKISDSH